MHKENSQEEVIRRNSDLVYRLAFSLVKSKADADDIYQDVFWQYLRRIPIFENEQHEKAWFIRVTVNRCKNHWKSPWMKRRAELHEEAGLYVEARTGEGTVSMSGEHTAEAEENLALIETVRQLPEKYRVVIHLFYYEEMSVEESGRITGSRASTVRTRLTRARRMLKERLGGL